MKKIYAVLSLALLAAGELCAQNRDLARRGLPYLRQEDQRVLQQQSDSFFKAIEPLAASTGEYAVNVYSSGRRVARGTVTEQGVLTKWSELVSKGDNIWVVGHDGEKREAFVKAVYIEYDLALLDFGGGLPSIDLAKAVKPSLGEFLLAVGPAKEVHGFGVVSVAPRSLRETDKAFLGVRMDSSTGRTQGVRLLSVERGSAAARAGLAAGDVVTQVNDLKVNGLYEFGNFLQKLQPGEQILLHFIRVGREYSVEVTLGARPDIKQYSPQRMQMMKRMGGEINDVAEGFPDVLQSDMHLDREDAGSPIFDLDGVFVGVVAARASRIKTYIIPANKLREQLSKKPDIATSQQRQMQLVEQRRSGLTADEFEELRQLRDIIARAERRILEIEGGQ